MTTISTYLAASLVAVTFGWVPSEQAAPRDPSGASAGPSSSAEGYDYLVKLSPEDLEALRDGRAVDLVSALPTEIGPIERVRVLVGEGDAPRRLRERDRLAPRRLAALSNSGLSDTALSDTAQAHTVAKPVVPEWKDAARLVANDKANGETAQQRTAYQNPTTLQEGFEQATKPLADAGKWVENQSKNLADGTAQLLESLAPPGTASNPYGSRPQPTAQSTVAPPEFSASPQQAQYQQPYTAPTNPSAAYPSSTYPPSSYPPSSYPNNTLNSRGTVDLPPPPTSAPASSNLVERFADESNRFGATSQQVLSPVPRTDDRPMTGVGATAPTAASTTSNPWDPFNNPSSGSFTAPAASSQSAGLRDPVAPAFRTPENGGFASSPSSETWDPRFVSAPAAAPATTPTGGGFAAERPGLNPPALSSGATGAPPLTGWAGDQSTASPSGLGGAPPAAAAATVAAERSLMEGVIMIALGAGMCFTWIAYIDVRNKYLSLLRGAPGSGYSTAA